jgi:pectin methylesterase-like acyl-CoA thioesterase
MRQVFSSLAAFLLILLPITDARPRVAHLENPVSVVGTNPADCPGAQFSTIQAAVNAASPGTVIRICPGTYPEQVSIKKPLSLHGESGVVIEPSNVTANATGTASGQAIAAIILVQDTTDVDIRDVIVDGTNNGITACAPDLIGVLYQNASGEVKRVAVRNMTLTTKLNGCQSGSAILIQSGSGGASVVEVRDSSIHDYQKNGITANEVGTEARIEDNVVTGVGPTTGAAQNGIQVGFGAEGTISRNNVANHIWSPCVSLVSCDFTADDILVIQSDGVSVEQNIAGISQTGIAIVANHAHVARNHVFETLTFDGIELTGNDNEARDNSITHSDRAGVFIQGNNNDVEKNRINEAAFGVLKVSGSTGNIIRNNDFSNAIVSVQDPAGRGSKASPYR